MSDGAYGMEGYSLRDDPSRMEQVVDRATAMLKKRNLEGNVSNPGNSDNSNSFSVLSNNAIMVRAGMMGVDIPTDKFDSIDLLKELELAMDNLSEKIVLNRRNCLLNMIMVLVLLWI
jgi:hypothetical protein